MPDASNKETGETRDYKETLFLPKTAFPMRAGLPKREPEFLKQWLDADMYTRLRESAEGRPLYVLHDGPPYANGHLHMGHAFNKILKDIVVRSRQMLGYDSNYVPGWDCHGLPIEWKVEEEFRAKGKAKRDVPMAAFRKACREYAQKWVKVQSEEFRRYGVEGDWDNPYTTMAFEAEAAIVSEFLKFVEKGLVYRGSMPVMWSPVEQTALAEAEIEYHDHVSTTIWVKFPVLSIQNGAGAGDERRDYVLQASIVIWTTTPWTIPGNRAICYGPKLSYGLYEVETMRDDLDFDPWTRPGEKLIIADKLAESVREAGFISAWRRLGDVDPAGFVCEHPLKGHAGGYRFQVPLLAGDHVTDDDGTGFVHTAPGHGADDYFAWMSPTCASWRRALAELEGAEIPHTVDEFGAYTADAPGFEGAKVIVAEGKKKGKDGDANKKVIDALVERGALLARGRLTHAYPHSWRSKAPVIFRNTPQWFIRLGENGDGGLREKALKAIDETQFTPEQGRKRIRAMVENRPDWLISRQRAWGVPLTIFVNKTTGEILTDQSVNERIIGAVKEAGADAWFDSSPSAFLGEDYLPSDFEKVEDILDVWFDSGSTHAFVLEQRKDLHWPADLYLEGSDQHRGWFQSSLLESCGTRSRAPFKAVLTHGFVLDGEGRKMSKSLGNVVDPADVIQKYGAEILRIWTASSDYTEDLRIGDEIIGSAVDAYRKLRNTLRYLLGALDGFEETERVEPEDMPELERYVLHRLSELDETIRDGYDRFDLKGVWRRCFEFASMDLSAFYLDIRKDSLYCDRTDALRRRAARTVMDLIFERLTAWLAPICVFTAEEARQARASASRSIHLDLFPETPKLWRDDALAAKWRKIRNVRRAVTGALEVERREKRIGASLEAAPAVYVGDKSALDAFDGLDAAEIFITSGATLSAAPPPEAGFRLEGVEDSPCVETIMAEGEKCARCWRILPEVGVDDQHKDLCTRCADAVAGFDAARGDAA